MIFKQLNIYFLIIIKLKVVPVVVYLQMSNIVCSYTVI